MKSILWERAVVYDVETKRDPDEVPGGWENPEAMGFATAVAYEYGADKYHFFIGKEGCLSLAKLLHNQLAVTFNGIKFDSRVVLSNDRDISEDGHITCSVSGRRPADVIDYGFYNFDILLEYIRSRFNLLTVGEAEKKLGDEKIHDGSFTLDGLAEGTLSMNKCGHGAHAPVLFREKRFAELFEYNLHDVRLTKKLLEFIIYYGFVVDRQRRKVTILNLRESGFPLPR